MALLLITLLQLTLSHHLSPCKEQTFMQLHHDWQLLIAHSLRSSPTITTTLIGFGCPLPTAVGVRRHHHLWCRTSNALWWVVEGGGIRVVVADDGLLMFDVYESLSWWITLFLFVVARWQLLVVGHIFNLPSCVFLFIKSARLLPPISRSLT
jgi:hypothetical protein